MTERTMNLVSLIMNKALNLPLVPKEDYVKLMNGERIYFNVDTTCVPTIDGFVLFRGENIIVGRGLDPLDLSGFSLKFTSKFINLIEKVLKDYSGDSLEVYLLLINIQHCNYNYMNGKGKYRS